VNKMSDIKQIMELYKLYGSIRRVAKELHISQNTVKKYVERVQSVRKGIEEEIIPEDRQIRRQCSVVTSEIKEKIHHILEENHDHPRKQRWNGKKIWRHLVQSGNPILSSPYAKLRMKMQTAIIGESDCRIYEIGNY